MSQHDTLTLEPCPFCGNEAHFVDDLIIVYAACTNCGATGAHSSYKTGAASAWNRRYEAQQPAQAPCGTVTAYEDSTGQHYQFTPSVEWAGARRFDVFEAPQPFDRARETSRRQSAVELLLSIGYVWNDGKWQVQHTEPFGYFRSEPFGWTNCAETDDGAIALYEAPPAQAAADALLKALRETQEACGVSQCPWCGVWGANYAESERPADYCHHDYQLMPWRALATHQQRQDGGEG